MFTTSICATIMISTDLYRCRILLCVVCVCMYHALLHRIAVCVSALMHGKTGAMSFLGFDPLSLLPVTFLSTLPQGQILLGNGFAYL